MGKPWLSWSNDFLRPWVGVWKLAWEGDWKFPKIRASWALLAQFSYIFAYFSETIGPIWKILVPLHLSLQRLLGKHIAFLKNKIESNFKSSTMLHTILCTEIIWSVGTIQPLPKHYTIQVLFHKNKNRKGALHLASWSTENSFRATILQQHTSCYKTLRVVENKALFSQKPSSAKHYCNAEFWYDK